MVLVNLQVMISFAMVRNCAFSLTITFVISRSTCRVSLFHLWLSRASLAIRKSAYSTRSLTARRGRFGQLWAKGTIRLASQSSLQTRSFLSTAQRLSFYLTIASRTGTTSATKWKSAACLLPLSIRHRCWLESIMVRESARMTTKRLVGRTFG